MFALTFGLGALFFGALFFILPWFKGLSNWALLCSWGIKAFASIILLYVYTSIYPLRKEADVFKYYDDGIMLSEIAAEQPAAFTRIMLGTWNAHDLVYLNRLNYWFRKVEIDSTIKLNS